MTWSVYVHCALCSERTSSYRHADSAVAGRRAQVEARALGFLELPPVPERGREHTWLCPACRGDLLAALAATPPPPEAA